MVTYEKPLWTCTFIYHIFMKITSKCFIFHVEERDCWLSCLLNYSCHITEEVSTMLWHHKQADSFQMLCLPVLCSFLSSVRHLLFDLFRLSRGLKCCNTIKESSQLAQDCVCSGILNCCRQVWTAWSSHSKFLEDNVNIMKVYTERRFAKYEVHVYTDINHIYELRIKNRSESDLRGCEAT